MRNLVSHDSRQLRFVVGTLEYSPIDINKSTGECECVDFRVVHHSELIRILLAGGFRCQAVSQSRDVRLNRTVRDERQLLIDLGRCLFTHFYILRSGKQIESGLEFGALSQQWQYDREY